MWSRVEQGHRDRDGAGPPAGWEVSPFFLQQPGLSGPVGPPNCPQDLQPHVRPGCCVPWGEEGRLTLNPGIPGGPGGPGGQMAGHCRKTEGSDPPDNLGPDRPGLPGLARAVPRAEGPRAHRGLRGPRAGPQGGCGCRELLHSPGLPLGGGSTVAAGRTGAFVPRPRGKFQAALLLGTQIALGANRCPGGTGGMLQARGAVRPKGWRWVF